MTQSVWQFLQADLLPRWLVRSAQWLATQQHLLRLVTGCLVWVVLDLVVGPDRSLLETGLDSGLPFLYGYARMPKWLTRVVDALREQPAATPAYAHVLEALPVGHAYCRMGDALTRDPAEGSEGCAAASDFVLMEINPAGQALFDRPISGDETPASARWPALVREHGRLFEMLAEVQADQVSRIYTGWFARVSKTIEFHAVWLGNDHFSLTMRDVTDLEAHSDSLLKLIEQTTTQVRDLKSRGAGHIEATNQLVTMAAESLYSVIDGVDELHADPRLPQDLRDSGTDIVARVQKVVNGLNKYALVTAFDCSPTLVSTAALVDAQIEYLRPLYPHVSFEKGSLPHTMAARDLLATLMHCIMSNLCNVSNGHSGARLEVSVLSERLDTVYCFTMKGSGAHELVDTETLGSTFADCESAIHVAIQQRAVLLHGGVLNVSQPDADTLQVKVSLGDPLAY